MGSSIIAHVPSSFPHEIPSSPPARLSDIKKSNLSDAEYDPSLNEDRDFMDEDHQDNLCSSAEDDSQNRSISVIVT